MLFHDGFILFYKNNAFFVKKLFKNISREKLFSFSFTFAV